MTARTEALWARQDEHAGDRWRLFRAVADAIDAERVLYPGSFVDVAPSFVWPSVVYVDVDRRAARFFSDDEGVGAIVSRHQGAPADPSIRFVHGDYSEDPPLGSTAFDLLISLYAGLVSVHCGGHLAVGGTLLVNPSHGDAAMASVDRRFVLAGVVDARSGDYSVRTTDLEIYLIPKRPLRESVADVVAGTGRGIAYTRSPFAYLFTRVR